MQDTGTAGVVRRTQPLHLTLPLPQACPIWPLGWSGEEATCTRGCCWHKKLPRGVWGELAVTGALTPPKHPAVGRLQAAELRAAWLDTATHQPLRSSFVPHDGRGSRGGQ